MFDLFITGSGRSGTSMVAGLFRATGAFMGERLLKPRISNPLGFFEDAEINSINEDILRPLLPRRALHDGLPYGMDAPGRGQLWLARLPTEIEVDAGERERARIRAQVARSPFCFKDPRFCYTIGNWRREAPQARVICVFRHPGEVVASVFTEVQTATYLYDFAISVSQVFELWRLLYQRVLERHSPHGRWLFLYYDDLFEPHVLERIEAFSGAAVDRSFPTRALKRSRSEFAIDHATQEVFDELMRRARE
ncbi:MAG TPA: sulfotransferase [Candidatus Binatia bacterium]|nr:sulfotransferase [Candidatus Binatia bacterium]